MNRFVASAIALLCLVLLRNADAEACWNFGTTANPARIEIEGQCITDPYTAVAVDSESFCLSLSGRSAGYYQFASGDISGITQTSHVNTETGLAGICLSLAASSNSALVAVSWHEGGVSSVYGDLGAFMVRGAGVNTPPTIGSVTVTPGAPNNADDLAFAVNATDPDGDQLTYTWAELTGPTGDISGKLALCSGASCTLPPLPPGDYSVTVRLEDGKGGVETETHPFVVSERVKATCTSQLDAGLQVSCTFVDLQPTHAPALATGNATVYVRLAPQGLTVAGGTELHHNPFDVLLNYYYRENQEAKEYQGTELLEMTTGQGGVLKMDFFLNFGKMATQLAPQYWPAASAPVTVPIELEVDSPFAVKMEYDLSIDRIANLRSAHVIERPGCQPGALDCSTANALLPHPSDRTQPYSDYRRAAQDFTKRVTLEDSGRWVGEHEVTVTSDTDDLRLSGRTRIHLDSRDFFPVLCPNCTDALRANSTPEPYWLIVAADFLDGVIGSVGLSSDAPGTYSIEIGTHGSESFTGWTYWSSFKGWAQGQVMEKALEKAVPVLGPAMAVKEVVEIVGAANTYQRTKFMRLNSAVRILTDPSGMTSITTREGEVEVFLEGDTVGIGSVAAGETGLVPYDQDTLDVRTSTEEEIAAADETLGILQEMVHSRTLRVSVDGNGTGTVTSSPSGVSCSADCSDVYLAGTTVILAATADAGATFVGWGGDCSEDGAVTLDADRTCTATFTLSSAEGTGGGSGGGGGGGGCFLGAATLSPLP